MAVKKRRFYFVGLIFIITLVLIGIKIKIDKKNVKIMNSREVGGEDDIMYHLSGVVKEREFNTLIVELDGTDESNYFFDMKEIRLNCSGCKSGLLTVSEGTIINKFYFFKWNVNGADVIVEDIILAK